MKKKFLVKGKVWKYPGPAGWHFVYLGKTDSEEIHKLKTQKVGFGFIKVHATLGNTSWDTTLFPTKEGPYLIAIKASVRKKEGVLEGETVKITVQIM